MSKEKLYLVFQSTRVLNTVKFFNKLLKEKNRNRLLNDLKGKEFVELMLFNASSLWEVLDLINKDLARRLNGVIPADLQERINNIQKSVRERNNDYCNLLKEIRNKHSYHIAYDQNYAPSFFSDGPSRYDLKIGVGLSSKEKDIVYTLEDDILMSYLMREFNKPEEEIYDMIINAIAYYEHELIDLFNKILFNLVEKKIYIS